MHTRLLAGAAAAAIMLAASPAAAAVNLINNGSFEEGPLGTGGFTGWTLSNPPASSVATVIAYNSTATYPNGAFGEAITPDDLMSLSPDSVGTKAAYFVSDVSVNETLSQNTFLTPGFYEFGFSYYLPQNGLNNVGDASFTANILGQTVATTAINSLSPAQTWILATGTVEITSAGNYLTSFVFNSNLGGASKDIVIDRVYAVAVADPNIVPEPGTWAMLIAGFGLVGGAARRRRHLSPARVLA